MKAENKKGISRRSILKATAMAGMALAMPSELNKIFTSENKQDGTHDNNKIAHITNHRVLSTGEAALEVSALGFGVMGMTYNRIRHKQRQSSHPTTLPA